MWTLVFILVVAVLFAGLGIILATRKIEQQMRNDYNRLASAERKLWKDIGNAARIRNLKHRRIS